MRHKLFVVGLVLGLISCHQNTRKTFHQLVNDNFLKFVDTAAYSSGKLIQIPNHTLGQTSHDSIYVLIDTLLNSSEEISHSISQELRRSNLNEFVSLIERGNNDEIATIDLSKIHNTGKFSVIGTDNLTTKMADSVAGKISFSEPFISQKLAIIILTIYASPKSGYTSVFLYRKQNGGWQYIKSFEIERW